jgi:hypothetical protein
MRIIDLLEQPDGVLKISTAVHISELDRLAGKLINYMHNEMPELTTSEGVEVLNVALWWVQFAAYSQFGGKVSGDPEQVENSYWRQAGRKNDSS